MSVVLLVQTAYAPIPESRHLDHGLGLGSGSSHHQGSGSLGGSMHLSGLGLSQGSGHQGSGNLGLDHSQGSEQFSGQLLGPNPSGSGASGWPGSGGQGQYGNPHSGPGADSSFAMQHEQLYQNTGGTAGLVSLSLIACGDMEKGTEAVHMHTDCPFCCTCNSFTLRPCNIRFLQASCACPPLEAAIGRVSDPCATELTGPMPQYPL